MGQNFQIISRVKKKYRILWFTFEEVIYRISTIKLPGDYGYETCVFWSGNRRYSDNEVVASYQTLEDALKGHMKVAKDLGAKTCNISLTNQTLVV